MCRGCLGWAEGRRSRARCAPDSKGQTTTERPGERSVSRSRRPAAVSAGGSGSSGAEALVYLLGWMRVDVEQHVARVCEWIEVAVVQSQVAISEYRTAATASVVDEPSSLCATCAD